MSIFTNLPALASSRKVKLTTTSEAAIYTQTTARACLSSVSICNITGSAATASLYFSSGATDYYLVKDKSIAANTTEIISGHDVPFASGEILNAISGTGNAIDIIATIVEAQNSMGG